MMPFITYPRDRWDPARTQWKNVVLGKFLHDMSYTPIVKILMGTYKRGDFQFLVIMSGTTIHDPSILVMQF